MDYQYVLFVDEAGDDKIGPLKPTNPEGHSEWLCMGGYLVKTEQIPNLEKLRDELLVSIGSKSGGFLHYRKYKPKNKFKISEKLAEFPARGFVVCSYKSTLIDYKNLRAEKAGNESSNKNWIYNFVVRLLLERVTEFVSEHAQKNNIKAPKLRIIMAHRKGHRFGHFKAYVHHLVIQAKSGTTHLDTKIVDPRVLSYGLVEVAPIFTEPGLQLSDVLVSSTFQSIEQDSNAYEFAPIKKLKPIIAGKERWEGSPLFRNNFGMTLYPAKLAHQELTEEQKSIFEFFDYDFDWLAKQK